MHVFGSSAPRRHALRRLLLTALPGALALALAACGTTDEEPDVIPEQPVEQLYNEAMDELYADRYEKAAQLFDEVERQHPYSVWATKGTLMSAFAYYRNSNYAEAVVALDHFISLHPAHENIDYAYYLRALCYYERITDVSRDQTMTERAKDSFDELINRFPDSVYAKDAKPKLVLVRDQLAGKEMLVGRFYQQRGHYLAAINRFRTVVTKYDQTSHVPEALLRLTELYVALGVMDQAQEYAAVLGYNFPGSDWYADSYDLIMENRDKGAAAPAPAPAAQAAPAAPAPAAAAAAPAAAQAAQPAQQQGAYPNYYTDYYYNQAPASPAVPSAEGSYSAYYQALQQQSQTGYYAPPAQPAPQPAPQAAPQPAAPPAAAPAPTSSAAPQYPAGGAAAAQGDAWGGAAQTNSGTTGPSNPGY